MARTSLNGESDRNDGPGALEKTSVNGYADSLLTRLHFRAKLRYRR